MSREERMSKKKDQLDPQKLIASSCLKLAEMFEAWSEYTPHEDCLACHSLATYMAVNGMLDADKEPPSE